MKNTENLFEDFKTSIIKISKFRLFFLKLFGKKIYSKISENGYCYETYGVYYRGKCIIYKQLITKETVGERLLGIVKTLVPYDTGQLRYKEKGEQE